MSKDPGKETTFPHTAGQALPGAMAPAGSLPATTSATSPVLTPASSAPVGPNPADVLDLLSKPRIHPYQSFFRTSNDRETVGAYLWAQAVTASLHPFVGLIEIVLRNAIHISLSQQCSGGSSQSFAWYDRAQPKSISLQGKSLDRVEELLCSGMNPPVRIAVQPSPDDVVSNLSFGFWPNVMEGLNMRHSSRAFTDVFCHHPGSKPKHWSFAKNRELVVLRMKRLQDLRNKICHFEPVWKLHWLAETTPSPGNYSHSLQGLRSLHTSLVELLEWCSPEAVEFYKNTFGWNWFNRLCTSPAIRSFLADPYACGYLSPFNDPGAPASAQAIVCSVTTTPPAS